MFSIYNNDGNSARSVWKKYLMFQNCEIYFNSLYRLQGLQTEETEETVETVECGGAVQAKRPWALHPQDFVYAFLCGQQQQHLLLTQNCEQGGRDHCTG